MSSNTTSIPTIILLPQLLSQYLSLTVGFLILILGVFGNCLNILIFLIYGHYKNNACSQYMLAGSVFESLFLLTGLITRIFGQGFSMDFTLTNRLWCKLRSSCLDIISFCSFTCICFQSIDIFFITSRSVTMRHKSNVKVARYLLIICVIVWTLIETPSFVFQDLALTNGSPSCMKTSATYQFYHTYVQTLVLSICLPLLVVSFFAYRIYRNIRTAMQSNRNNLSAIGRRMTRMALFHIGILLLFQFPYGVATAYFTASTNLPKSSERQLDDKLTQTFFNVYVYGLYGSSFYGYYAASKQFRRHVVDTMKRLQIKRRGYQIQPISRDLH